MKTITLCADDYGQDETISAGIRELIKLGRLSAVSCMTIYENWPTQGAHLAAMAQEPLIHNNLDIGLHFDLTHFIAERGWTFSNLIINSCRHKIDLPDIAAELNRQLDAFESVFGGPPAFVDGHQHVQIFPGIRTAFIKTLAQRYTNKLPYIRWSAPAIVGHDAFVKAIILRLLGMGFAPLARAHGFDFPQQFLGAYSLNTTQYPRLFKGWLRQAKHGALFMCHPGKSTRENIKDPIKNARAIEYQYFSSDEFLQDLASNQVKLGKWINVSTQNY